jgi:hypothetical protein
VRHSLETSVDSFAIDYRAEHVAIREALDPGALGASAARLHPGRLGAEQAEVGARV